MRLIVFDLDRTLIISNSSFRFGWYLYQKKFFSNSTLILSLINYFRHKWLGMPIQALHAKAFEKIFKGQLLSNICFHVDNFLETKLANMFYAPSLQRLREAQKRNDYVIIVSSSPDFLVRKISDYLNVPHWKATKYHIDSVGKLKKISHVMGGKEKARFVANLSKQLGLPLSSVTVYSDSILDYPLIKIAGEAIGVLPDAKLKNLCLKNGWEIL